MPTTGINIESMRKISIILPGSCLFLITCALQLNLQKGVTFRDLLDKPWSQVSFFLPPGARLPFCRVGFSITTSQLFVIVDFHRFLCQFTLSRFPPAIL